MNLETERLILRPWEDRDRAPMAAIMGDATVRRFYPQKLTPEETSAQLDHHIEMARQHGLGVAAAELRATGELVGLVGLAVLPDMMREAIPNHPQVEIGWVFAERFWGQGLAPEGARAWLDYGWSIGLPEIVAFTATINLPSQRVMQKIGMIRIPSSDFMHPRIPEDHPLRQHVLYRIANPAAPR
jgi:RimJ/RimL family protein N-acetyltransferase